MPQYLPLPDGSSVTIREGESPQQAWARAQQMYPEAFGGAQPTPEAAPQAGGIAAAKAGYQTLKGDIAALAGRTGLMDEAAAEQYKAEREAEAKKIFKPTEQGWTEAPFTKLAELGGGSLPYMAAPVAAGALGAMAPVAGAGVGAAGLASLAQFTGSNLSRQMEEGKKLGETSLGAAAAAAVPQAALDMLSFKMAPGIRNIFAAAGKEVPEKVAEQIAKQGTANMLKDYGAATAKAMGAEGVTEAGQQFLERLQAGLNLTDAQARDEYWDSLIGGAVLGGTIAPMGRYAERGKIQREQEVEAQKAKREERAALALEKEKAAEVEAARKLTPEYEQDVAQRYQAVIEKRDALAEQAGVKVEKGDLAGNALRAQAKKELKEFMADPETKAIVAEHASFDAQRKARAAAEARQGQPLPVESQQDMFGGAAPIVPAAEPFEAVDYAQQIRGLEDGLDMLREQSKAAKDPAQVVQLGQQYAQLKEALAKAEAEAAKAPERKIASLQKNMQKALENGDVDVAARHAAKLVELGAPKAAETVQGVQEAMPMMPRTNVSESAKDFANRTYPREERGANVLAAKTEEEDYLAQVRAEEEAVAREAARERKVVPEVLALERMAQRPAGAESMSIPLETQAPEAPKYPSSAIGQMKQLSLGEDVTYTAEEERQRGPFTKAPGTGEFRLQSMQGEAARPTDAASIEARLASALARKDLPQESYAFLRRAENAMPGTEELRNLVDKELAQIEERRPGADYLPKTAEVPAGKIGEAEVSKRLPARGRPVLRGPSVKIPGLLNKKALNEALLPLEQAKGEGPLPARQQGLFEEETSKLGMAKMNRAAFIQFMRSKFVQELKATIAKDKAVAKRIEELPKLKARVEELTAGVAEMEKINLQYAQAARILQQDRDLGKVRRNMGDILGALNKVSVEGMQLDGRIEELQQLRGQLVQEGRALGESVELPFLSELNHIEEQLTRAQTDNLELRGALNTLKGQLRVQEAKSTLAKLNPKTTAPAALERAKEALRAAQVEAGVVEQAAREKETARKQEAAAKRRADEATSGIAEEKAQNAKRKEEQKRIESLYGDNLEGVRYEAIDQAKRWAIDHPYIERTEAEKTEEIKNPSKTLGGYKSEITKLEREIVQAQKQSDEARERDLDKLKNDYAALTAQYKATKSADDRAKILPDLEKAEAAYNEGYRKFKNEPRRPWVGMREQTAALGELYSKHDDLEARIQSGEIELAEKGKSREQQLPSKRSQQKAQKEIYNRMREEAKTRADAPTTSGEALTPSQAKKAAKQQKTLFGSTGSTPVKRDTLAERQETVDKIRNRQAEGKLTPFDEVALRRIERAVDAGLPETDYDLATDTTDAQQDMLSEAGKEALADGRTLDVLRDIAKNSPHEFIRDTAEKLIPLVSRTRIGLSPDIQVKGKDVPAAYSSIENAVGIRPGFESEANVIHELTHAATIRALEGPEEKLNADQLAAKRELIGMFNALTKDGTLKGKYAAENVKEFASEVQSNANLREHLGSKKLFGSTALRKIFDALLRLIGKSPSSIKTEDAQAVIERLYMQSGKLEAAPLAAGKPAYANAEMAELGNLSKKLVSEQKSVKDRVLAASGGFLGAETQLVDRFAPLERISKTMDALKGSQMMMYLRSYDQRMNFVSQAVENGALKLVEKERADGQKEYLIEATPGASIKGVVETLKDAKPYVGNGEAVNRLFTMYLSALRVKSKGLSALNFGDAITQEELDSVENKVNSIPELKDIFEAARQEYNDYNRDMINFVAETGAISKETAKALTKNDDYIPWYRESNGVAELVIGSESPIRIGSIAEQPYLHELVGGDRPILDFMTSSVQNTNMLADMGLRNLATKNAVFELVDMDMAKIVGASSGNNIVKFKVDGKDKYASIETESAGIPGDLLVKGMQGIPTQMPAILRIMSLPSRLLRKGVTLSPLYAAKQLFRDSLAAPILSGADFKPVYGALKEINKPTKELLERRGIVGGQIFTGTSEDLTKILRDITDGKSGWLNALAKAEAIGMEADALTRRAQYNSYINQGLSEMEATLASLESMNFNKRGASPSIHMIGAMIPFFNAQIQGLNVLYKAMTGNMPFNERLKIQEKMLVRGGMLAAGTLAYAAMMQDDEAYKNATPDQKYGNWFVRIPGVNEPVRIPVPFEVGYIFKALPEALYNTMVDEHGGEEAVKALKQILLQTIPGGTSYGIPQALKPAIEAGLGKSFYTGRDILSAHEKSLLPEEQFRTNTSEAAKLIGKGLGVSPIVLENLVTGYTGPMGLAFLQAVSLGVPTGNTPEQATKRLSEMPLVGGAFQPNDAGGIINATYDRFEDAVKIKRTVDGMMESGRTAEAKELLQKSGNEYMAGEMGDYFATQMKALTQFENAIRAMNISPDEKRARLDKLKALKISLAEASRRTVDKIAPQ